MNEIVNDNDVNDDANDDVNDDDDDDDDDDHNDNDEYYIIKQLNNYFKTIDKAKSLKEQIEILKTKDFLSEYWHFGYHHGHK